MGEPSRGRFFQFSLRSLLMGVLLVVLGIVFGQERFRRERLEAEVQKLAAQVKSLESQKVALTARAQTRVKRAAGSQRNASPPENLIKPEESPFRLLEPYRGP